MSDKARTLALIAAAGSLALLAGAFLFQVLGYPPCKLCLWQRWPHAAAIAVGLFVWLRPAPILAWLGAAATLTTATIGLYHTGVERKIFVGPTSCTSNPVEGMSPEELLNQIMAAPLIRCDEVAWSLMSLSMASWNALFSLALAALWLTAARRAAS